MIFWLSKKAANEPALHYRPTHCIYSIPSTIKFNIPGILDIGNYILLTEIYKEMVLKLSVKIKESLPVYIAGLTE